MNENYCPPLCNTQKDFEREMARLNDEQCHELKPVRDREGELIKQRANLTAQINAIKTQLDLLKVQFVDNEAQKRTICEAYRAMKHELIKLNPKEKFQNEQ